MPIGYQRPLAVASIVLAAGRSSRMGEQHKLLALVGSARLLLQDFSKNVHSVAMPTDAVMVDVDTPAQLDCAKARGVATTRCS